MNAIHPLDPPIALFYAYQGATQGDWFQDKFTWLDRKWTYLKATHDRFQPLFRNISSVFKKISTIATQLGSSTFKMIQSAYKIFDHLALISVVFIPLHVYKIVQITRSDHPIQKKALDILIELGGLLGVTISVMSWFASNVLQKIGTVLPYLMGVSLLFQAVDIYRKWKVVQKTELAASQIGELYKKIIEGTLEREDKETLEKFFKFTPDKLDAFLENAKTSDEDTVRSDLASRVDRTLWSNKMAVLASVIEMIASVVFLAFSIAVPPLMPVFTIVNAALLGGSGILKIALFVYDYKTENLAFHSSSVS